MATINSVMGPIDTSKLGFTLMHEHLCSTSAGIWQSWPELFGGREGFVNKISGIMNEAKQNGVDSFVDVTTIDLGRDIRLMREVAERTPVNIIACTGHWLDPSRTMLARSVDQLTDLFTREIEHGIEGTAIRAGIIKVANDEPGMTEFGERLLHAAARAHKATGVPITTHTGAKIRLGERQAQIFEEEGVEPKKVTIGHSDDTDSLGYLTGLLKQGYWLDLDRLRLMPAMPPSFPERADVVAELVKRGFEDQLMLSHDFPLEIGLRPEEGRKTFWDGNPDGILFITKNFLPALRERGVSDRAINKMMVENPRRYFEG